MGSEISYIDIPEWEIEEAIIRSPSLIDLSSLCKNISFIDSQYYLNKSGRFIDLLYQCENGKYIIVELKKGVVDEISVIIDQVLHYKKELSLKFKVDENSIICVLATIKNFSDEVVEASKHYDIKLIKIDEEQIFKSLPLISKASERKRAAYRLFKRRYPEIKTSIENFQEEYLEEARSIELFLEHNTHDHCAKKLLAILFKQISAKSPLCSHEVFITNYTNFPNELSRWFWLFYSVLDRRANASTFIKAAQILQGNKLYNPKDIVSEVKHAGKNETVIRIRNILEASKFPLSKDSSRLDLAMPTSIVEAAIWYSKHNFSFKYVRDSYEKNFIKKERTQAFLSELKKEIYGVGDRIAGQIIRGFILKDDWQWNCDEPSLLEKCGFNITFASYPRFALINEDDEYYPGLSAFADQYLNKNYCIVSHTLWFIRKRYCLQPKRCFECPMSGFCNYYKRSYIWKLKNHNINLFDDF